MAIPNNWQSESSSQYTDKDSTDSIDFTDSTWFDYFENNTQLQALIEQGIFSNRDLVIASSRVDRALAELRLFNPTDCQRWISMHKVNGRKLAKPVKHVSTLKPSVMNTQPV